MAGLPDTPAGTVHRFGLELTPDAFDRLGEALERINEAERQAWREVQ